MENLCISKDYKPRLVNNVYFSELYKNKKNRGYIIIGLKDTDVQYIVNAKNENVYKKLFNSLDGKNSVNDLIDLGFGNEKELLKLLTKLRDKGFFEDYVSNMFSFNEAEQLSIRLLKIKFTVLNNKKNICAIIILLFKILFVINLILFLNLFIKNKNIFFEQVKNLLTFGNNSNSIINNQILGYLLINLLMAVFFILHELSHVIVGVKNGFSVKNISFNLFLAFIPIFYVKINNLYVGNKKQVLLTLSAGIIMNLFLGFLFMSFFFIFADVEILKIIAMANFRLVYVNLLPFSLTDGYFILGIVCNEPNARLNYYKFIAKPNVVKAYNLKHKIITIFLFLISIISIFLELLWFLSSFLLYFLQPYKYYFIGILIIIFIMMIHFINKRKFKKMKLI